MSAFTLQSSKGFVQQYVLSGITTVEASEGFGETLPSCRWSAGAVSSVSGGDAAGGGGDRTLRRGLAAGSLAASGVLGGRLGGAGGRGW